MDKRKFIEHLTHVTGNLVEQINQLPETAQVSAVHVRDASRFEHDDVTNRKTWRPQLTAYVNVKMTLHADSSLLEPSPRSRRAPYVEESHGNGFGQK